MYELDASAADMTVLGMKPEDYPDNGVDCWAQNTHAYELLVSMSSQWRMGPTGPTGLDYAALPAVLRLAGIPRADWTDTFEALRVMESEALSVMNEARK